MFKPEDKVFCVKTDRTALDDTKIYTIRLLTEDNYVTLLERHEWDYYHSWRFILATPLMRELF